MDSIKRGGIDWADFDDDDDDDGDYVLLSRPHRTT